MSQAREDATAALFEAIEKTAKESLDYNGTTQSQMVRDAALAYRYLVGGPQPGGVAVTQS